jgi:hypothetical protein
MFFASFRFAVNSSSIVDMLSTSFEMLGRFTRSYLCFPKTLTSSSFALPEPKTMQTVSFTGVSESGDG